MSSFTTVPLFEKVKGKYWIVRRKFTYHVGSKYSKDKIHIPYGFKTDFASIPRLLWGILPPAGSYMKAAVVHDLLYQTKTRSRKEADDIFLEAMGVLGTKWFVRHMMYYAVRWFGFMAWKT